MNSKTKYTNERLGRIRVVPDFLPAPENLVLRNDGVKVTLALSRRSVEFFKDQAALYQTQYQRMIRRLLDAYVDVHSKIPTPKAGRRPAKGRIVPGPATRSAR